MSAEVRRRESETHADGEGSNELAGSSSDDEPKSVSERGVDVVGGLVETVASGHEEAEVELCEQSLVSRAARHAGERLSIAQNSQRER